MTRSEGLLEEILERVDIAEYISQFVDLKKTGNSFKGLCPFHDERTPSFSVTPEKKLYHCFGCGAAGNVVGFAMKYHNLDFVDAMKMLCERYNIVFEKRERPKHYNEIFEIHNELLIRSKQDLLANTGRHALEYMLKRGFDRQILDEYDIGYFPQNFDISFLRKKYSKNSLAATGLFYEYSGRLNFKFAGRLSFPIKDTMGNVIAFSGRALKDDVKPKYINSPTTDIFEKRKFLYNMDGAKSEMKKEKTGIVVEGYIDVMRCSQAGIKNTVSPMGTSFTKEQAALLKRYCDDVILVFDGDFAGKKAAYRSLETFIDINFFPQVVFLPEEDDPDSLIKEKGVSAFLEKLESRKDLFVTYINNLSKYADSYQKKLKIIERIKSLLIKVKNPYLKDEYFAQTAKIFDLNEETLRKDIEFSSHKNTFKRIEKGEGRLNYFCEENFLASLFSLSEDVIDSLLEDMNEDYFSDENFKKIFKKIIDVLQNGDIMHVLLNDEEIGEIASNILITDFGDEDPYAVALKNKNKLRFNYLERMKKIKINELSQFKNDPVKSEEILEKLNNILTEIKELRSSVLEV
ncbi:MAG TPA: DNA primase [Flexistipes sinusarabici]|uniref:DNA primase n=1 Tax=Flexistipes sinusarabici TaxID=2352 RepID=A0A3D5Q9F8_FLESI|nr:DNA primase [Flexistipes sinusarabici]